MRRRYDDGENNFDAMYDASQYRRRPIRRDIPSEYDSAEYDGDYVDDRISRRRRRPSRDYDSAPREEYQGDYEEESPRKRSFFRPFGGRKREPEVVERGSAEMVGTNQFVVMTPKNFDDIKGIIDNLKLRSALIVDLCKLNDKSVQRVMDYINGAIYALDGSIQCINAGVFLLTPSGMGISVPIDYIKHKWERNRKRK